MSFWTGTHWEPETPRSLPTAHGSRIRHVIEAVTEGALVSLLVVGLLAGTTLAGRSSDTSVRVDDGSFAGTTTAYAGPSSATWVRARCYQNGSLVYEQYRTFDSNRQATLTLGPTPGWSSGGASCTAQDGYWRRGTTWRVTSSTTFTVSP